MLCSTVLLFNGLINESETKTSLQSHSEVAMRMKTVYKGVNAECISNLK